MKTYRIVKTKYKGDVINYGGGYTEEDVKSIVPKSYKADKAFSTDERKYYFSKNANVCYIVEAE